MEIAFLIVNEKSPFGGTVRPFINWSKHLSKKHTVNFIFHNCDKQLIDHVKQIKDVKSLKFESVSDIINYIKSENIDILLTDDDIARLKLISKIKEKTSIKTGIYVQILFGVHSITKIFSLEHLSKREQLKFKATKFIPFSFFSKIYSSLLKKHDILIANSKFTSTFMHVVYGLETQGVVYPPVDSNIFKINKIKKKNQSIIYLGSNAGDTNIDFVNEIIAKLNASGTNVLVIGNATLANKISSGLNAKKLNKVPDKKLSNLYSESQFVICPQKWETFGYVEAESLMCGTPVVTFNCMGMQEVISDTSGFLADNKDMFLGFISKKNHKKYNLKPPYKFDLHNSTEALENILVGVVNK